MDVMRGDNNAQNSTAGLNLLFTNKILLLITFAKNLTETSPI